MLKRFVFVSLFVLLLSACVAPSEDPVPAPAATAPAEAPQPTQSSIISGTAETGEHLAMVFDRLTGTDVGSYAEFGYCWTSQAGGYSIRFADKYAFLWGRGVVYLPNVWLGDAVSIGTRAEIEATCPTGMLIASTSEAFDEPPLHGTKKTLTVNGGPYDTEVVYILLDIWDQEGDEVWVVDASPLRIPAEAIFERMAAGMTVSQAIDDYRQTNR